MCEPLYDTSVTPIGRVLEILFENRASDLTAEQVLDGVQTKYPGLTPSTLAETDSVLTRGARRGMWRRIPDQPINPVFTYRFNRNMARLNHANRVFGVPAILDSTDTASNFCRCNEPAFVNAQRGDAGGSDNLPTFLAGQANPFCNR